MIHNVLRLGLAAYGAALALVTPDSDAAVLIKDVDENNMAGALYAAQSFSKFFVKYSKFSRLVA